MIWLVKKEQVIKSLGENYCDRGCNVFGEFTCVGKSVENLRMIVLEEIGDEVNRVADIFPDSPKVRKVPDDCPHEFGKYKNRR